MSPWHVTVSGCHSEVMRSDKVLHVLHNLSDKLVISHRLHNLFHNVSRNEVHTFHMCIYIIMYLYIYICVYMCVFNTAGLLCAEHPQCFFGMFSQSQLFSFWMMDICGGSWLTSIHSEFV